MTSKFTKNSKKSISTQEAAKLLGISRIAVFKKIKKGQIKAEKVGRNYVIPIENISPVFQSTLDKKSENRIIRSVDRVIQDYGEVLKRLGDA